MNTAAPTQKPGSNIPMTSGSDATSVGISKEHVSGGKDRTEVITSSTTEVELSKEVEAAGVKIPKEAVEISADIKKLGVSPSGPNTPLSSQQVSSVVLPLSDDQVIRGLHMQVYSAIRWLAEWCVRQLKKTHIAIKTVHGKIVRTTIK